MGLSIEAELKSWFDQWHISDTGLFNDWIGRVRARDFAAGEVLVHAGERVGDILLLQSGLVRLYYLSADGKERNKAFYGARQVTGAVSAAISGEPAPFTIEALQAGRLLSIDYATLVHLAPKHAEACQLLIQMLASAFIRNEQREALLLTCNAEQRYRWLLDNQPELLAQVPQFHIASYLGVDAVSLSRLKKKLES